MLNIKKKIPENHMLLYDTMMDPVNNRRSHNLYLTLF